mmetsp:Transcript_23044/g.35071  ORF Transcript_23044/g.35071 Transcript_23044/m.35071 type:complete len:89 (+) Transcript_23044:3-269(+)
MRKSSSGSTARVTPMTPTSPHWMQDDQAKGCTACHKEFGIFLRRHHCRACGRLVCGDCSDLSRMFTGGESLRACRKCAQASSFTSTPI